MILCFVDVSIDSHIEFEVGRDFLPPLFVLDARHVYFVRSQLLVGLSESFFGFRIVLTGFIVFPLLLFFNLLVDFLLQSDVLFLLFPLLLLFPTFCLLHLHPQLLLVLILLPGFAFSLLGIRHEQSPPKGLLIAYCDF